MSRRNRATKRVIQADTRFNSVLIARFINVIMQCGKKSIAEKIVYEALSMVKQHHSDKDEVVLFDDIITAVRPVVEVKSRRLGGANYQIPVEVSADRQVALSMRWLCLAAKKRNEKSMAKRLANEFLDALAGKGSAVKKRDDMYKMAEANRAFATFRH